jgi:cell shape-determining protein MreD
MARSVLFVLGMLACTFLQARVLSELGLDRLLNLPLLLSALFATPYQLPSRLAGATVAGLALDALYMRPFGVTSLALCAAVLAGSALRSDVEGWPRRFVAAGAAVAAGFATEVLLFTIAGEQAGRGFGVTLGWIAINLPVLLITTWVGSRRRERLRLDSTLRIQ